jgi:hypothetical protein
MDVTTRKLDPRLLTILNPRVHSSTGALHKLADLVDGIAYGIRIVALSKMGHISDDMRTVVAHEFAPFGWQFFCVSSGHKNYEWSLVSGQLSQSRSVSRTAVLRMNQKDIV